MPGEKPEASVERVWREQLREEGSVSLSGIQARAAAHAQRTARQKRLTYIVVAVLIAANLVELGVGMEALEQLGTGLVITAFVFMFWYYRRATGPVDMPEDLGLERSLHFYRALLIRQRDLVRTFWLWGALPFVPGIFLSLIGDFADRPLTMRRGIALAVAFGLLVALIAWMNGREARKLQSEIDGLDSSA